VSVEAIFQSAKVLFRSAQALFLTAKTLFLSAKALFEPLAPNVLLAGDGLLRRALGCLSVSRPSVVDTYKSDFGE
jgi:hypothetical protein